MHTLFSRWYLSLLLGVSIGITVALGMPPFTASLAVFIGYGVLFLAVGHASAASATLMLIVGYSIGFDVTTHHWVYQALLASPKQMQWLLPFSYLPVIVAGMFVMLLGVVFYTPWMKNATPWMRSLVMAIVLLGGTWLRHVAPFGGHPWLTMGYVFPAGGNISQIASWGGVFVLDALVVIISLALSMIMMVWPQRTHRSYISVGALVVMIVSIMGGSTWYGYQRLALSFDDYDTQTLGDTRSKPGIPIRLIQPNIKQLLVFDRVRARKLYQTELALSKSNLPQTPPTLIIWPESSLPFRLAPDDPVFTDIALRVIPDDAHLMAGTLLALDNDQTANAIVLINDEGRIVSTYMKKHLIPFGEVVPLEKWIPAAQWLRLDWWSLFAGNGQWQATQPNTAQPNTAPLPASVLPNRALICFEVTFPLELNNTHDQRWLLNISNDGWFGDSAALDAHFAIAQYRAIEHGLPLVRVAITGISGVINALGQIIAKADKQTEAFIDFVLPPALPPTLWMKYRLLIPFTFAVMMFLFLAIIGLYSLGMRHS